MAQRTGTSGRPVRNVNKGEIGKKQKEILLFLRCQSFNRQMGGTTLYAKVTGDRVPLPLTGGKRAGGREG